MGQPIEEVTRESKGLEVLTWRAVGVSMAISSIKRSMAPHRIETRKTITQSPPQTPTPNSNEPQPTAQFSHPLFHNPNHQTTKMKFSPILLVPAAFLASLVFSSPLPESVDAIGDAAAIEARQVVIIIIIFANWNWGGGSWTGSGVKNQCYNLPAAYNNWASSGKAAAAGYTCRVWDGANCAGTSHTFGSGGSAQFPSSIDNKASSYKCWW